MSCTSGKCSFTEATPDPAPTTVDSRVVQKVVGMLTALNELVEDPKVREVLLMSVRELQGQL
jgi:hypothetical protein